MKRTLAKVIMLMLTLALILSGCNLIEVDPVKQAAEDIQKINETYSAPVATYDGGNVTAEEAMKTFYDNYSQMYYMYYYYLGQGLTEEQVHGIIDESVEYRANQEVVAARFDQNGALTDEEIAAAEQSAQDIWEQNYAEIIATVDGKTDVAKDSQAQVLMKTYGLDIETLKANAIIDAKAERMEAIIRDEITEVTAEELQAAFDEKVEGAKESYTEDPSGFGSDMTGADAVIYWAPEGYRTVKHILVMPEEDVKNAYTDATSALSSKQTELQGYEDELEAVRDDDADEGEEQRSEEEIQKDIEACKADIPALEADVEAKKQACLDNVSTKTAEIYAKLAEDGSVANFEALIAEYGEDPGMQNEPTATRGYYVCAASTNWQQSFKDASMALANIGDYTAEPVVSGSGVHIIMYMSDVTAGAAKLDDVKATLEPETLENLKSAHYDEALAGWIAEANISAVDTETFEAAFSSEN